MESYIDEYNSLVDKKCKEQIKVKKNKSVKDILSGNAKYVKDLNAYVVPETLTKKQFMNGVKNVFKYVGKSEPKEVVLEDIYEKVFNSFTFEEFSQFMDLAQFGGFNSLNEAYNAFLDELRMSGRDLPAVSGDVFEALETESIGSVESVGEPLSLPPSLTAQSSMLSAPPSTPPLTRKEEQALEILESAPRGVLSEGLVSRRGAPPQLELPLEVKQELFFQGGVPVRINPLTDPAEEIFTRMGE